VFDFILTAAFVLAALLLLVTTIRDWRATKRAGYVLPVVAFVLAGILFIADPVIMGIPWLAGIVWLVIGLVLRVMVRGRSRRQA
jgi:hypothetical protein